MLLNRIATALVPLALIASARADVRVVSPSGPFTEIQAAVDVSVDGDVILVKAGTYASFVVRDLDLSIVADQGANVQVQGAIRVSAIHATQTLLLSGLNATGVASSNDSSRFGLLARNCPGTLLVEDCTLRGGIGQGACGLRSDGASLENCQNVVFVRCTLHGADEYVDWVAGYGYGSSGVGAALVSSRVAFYDSTLNGGRGSDGARFDCDRGYGYGGGDGGDACVETSSFLFASATTLRGGNGGAVECIPFQGICMYAGSGGSGLRGSSAPALGPQWLATSALGGTAGSFQSCGLGCGQPYYHGADGLPVQHTPAPTVLAGTARPMTTRRVVREGIQVPFTYTGSAGEAIELRVSDGATLAWLPSARGTLVPRRRGASPVQQVGTLPGSGTLTQTVTVGALAPGEQARRVFFQPLFIAPSGVATLGTPQALVILDSAF